MAKIQAIRPRCLRPSECFCPKACRIYTNLKSAANFRANLMIIYLFDFSDLRLLLPAALSPPSAVLHLWGSLPRKYLHKI